VFHHDWAENKGSASYTFEVDVPVSGCYSLEEYHPGSDYTCSRYLPRNAKLDISSGKLQKWTTINQAVNGAQWNNCNCDFYIEQGVTAELTMKNHPGEQCDTGNCFWVVDAFRLTWIGETCNAGGVEASTATSNTASTATSNGQVGTMVLTASWSGVGSVQVKLEEHEDVLETVLAAHFGRQSVEVLGIYKEGRRLHTGGHTHVEQFKIKFAASDVTVGSASQTNLRTELREAFDQVGAGIDFGSAFAEWGWTAVPEENDTKASDDGDSTYVYYIVGGAVAAVILFGTAVLMCLRRTKRDAATSASSQKVVTPQDEVLDLEGSPSEKKDVVDKKVDDVEIISASTDTPGTGDEHSEGSNSVQLGNNVQEETVVTGREVPEEDIPEEMETEVTGNTLEI
jgi:hypothetical protein